MSLASAPPPGIPRPRPPGDKPPNDKIRSPPRTVWTCGRSTPALRECFERNRWTSEWSRLGRSGRRLVEVPVERLLDRLIQRQTEEIREVGTNNRAEKGGRWM